MQWLTVALSAQHRSIQDDPESFERKPSDCYGLTRLSVASKRVRGCVTHHRTELCGNFSGASNDTIEARHQL